MSYAKQACDRGAPRGCTRVSMPRLTGDGAPKDVQGALGELDGMCARGEPSACAELIGLFSRGLGADVPRDPARVRVYAEKGCKAHDAQSCRVQSLLETKGHLRDHRRPEQRAGRDELQRRSPLGVPVHGIIG